MSCYLFHMQDFKQNPTQQKKKLIHIMSKIIYILPFWTSLSSWWGPRLQNSVPWTEPPRVPACIVLGRDLPIPPTIRLSFGSNRFLGDPRSLRRSQRRGCIDFCWENKETRGFFHDLHATKKEESVYKHSSTSETVRSKNKLRQQKWKLGQSNSKHKNTS